MVSRVEADAQTLDVAAVERYLAARLPGFKGPLGARKFPLGQSNPTFLLQGPNGRLVLRRKPPGPLLRSAHAVDREFRVLRALADTVVPVPRVHHLCEDDSVIGAMFYVMDYIDGRNFNEPTLDELTPDERSAVIDDMNRVLAALHEVDVAAIGLADYGPAGNYYERQVHRWTKQYRSAETDARADMDALVAAIEDRIPGDDGQRTLVHGDFRLDNMMFEHAGPRCVGLLDWELSTLGHPLSDLASVLMTWRLPPGRLTRGLAGIDRAAAGLPSDEAFVARYCERRGIDAIADLGFHIAFCFFRFASILQGVYRRSLDGNASDAVGGMNAGDMVDDFARRGLNALG